jgi:hypothetical protein
MGYFDKTLRLPMPTIPVPQRVRLWQDSDRLVLVWERPLLPCDGFIVLAGSTPEQLAPVERLSGGPKAALRWEVLAESGPCFAVACWRGEVVGEASMVVGREAGGGRQEAGGGRQEAGGRRQEAGYTDLHGTMADEVSIVSTLLPATSLPDCACCTPPRQLVAADGALQCPFTSELYAVLATGECVRAASLPYGLCYCCEARQPLIRAGEEIVCYGNPTQRYQLDRGQYRPQTGPTHGEALADADAIDAALRANSALLGANGVFTRR